jgi:hypothetical protein
MAAKKVPAKKLAAPKPAPKKPGSAVGKTTGSAIGKAQSTKMSNQAKLATYKASHKSTYNAAVTKANTRTPEHSYNSKEWKAEVNKKTPSFTDVVYEVSGAGDVMRFKRDPSLANFAWVAFDIATLAAGPVAKARGLTKAVEAAKAINAGADVRTAAAVKKALTTDRVVKATKGTGTVTTKSGKALPMTGIKSFSTAKNPKNVASGVKGAVAKDVRAAVKDAKSVASANAKAGYVAAAVNSVGKLNNLENKNKQNQKIKKKK